MVSRGKGEWFHGGKHEVRQGAEQEERERMERRGKQAERDSRTHQSLPFWRTMGLFSELKP